MPGASLPVAGEQERKGAVAAAAFAAGEHLVIQAGTGKTTTLSLPTHATRRRGRYPAFNRAIAQAAARAFPRRPSRREPAAE